MRFEVSYRAGTTHEVEVAASLVVLGRDPGCDVVLNDTKCSRRHAVVEDGPEGLVVRDTGSANGVYVNGKRVERAPLRPGDSVRLGDVTLTLLREIGETLVVGPEDLDLATPAEGSTSSSPDLRPQLPAAAREPPAAASARKKDAAGESRHGARESPVRSAAPPAAASSGRPLTVNVLAALWALFVPVSIGAALAAAARLDAGWPAWTAAAVLALVCGGLGTAMAIGLRALAGWARHLQIATAAVGILACPFSLLSATVLLYMGRAEVKAAFEPGDRGRAGVGAAETTFALSILAMLVLGLATSVIAVTLLRPGR